MVFQIYIGIIFVCVRHIIGQQEISKSENQVDLNKIFFYIYGVLLKLFTCILFHYFFIEHSHSFS